MREAIAFCVFLVACGLGVLMACVVATYIVLSVVIVLLALSPFAAIAFVLLVLADLVKGV